MFRMTLILLFFLYPLSLAATTLNRTVAVVNDEIVTSYQLERALEAKAVAGREIDDALRQELLDKMIEELLLGQRIRELKLTVAAEEIDAAIDDILKQNKITREQLKQALSQQGIDFTAYRETLSKQILRFKLMGREVQAKVEVTNREIRNYFDAHARDYQRPPEVRILHFTLKDAGADARQTLAAVRTRLVAGEPLPQVLAAFAGDERVLGGEMGRFSERELAPEFVTAIKDLPDGAVSPIVAQNEMLHLLIVAERIPGGVTPLEDVKDSIAARLQEEKSQARFKEWIAELKKNAYIVILPEEGKEPAPAQTTETPLSVAPEKTAGESPAEE
ncbi:MAG: peptidyl-prolyl cis-trans isomerase [Desulfuromonadales bacterium]|nr:peptidyl-prolyl cis-trans isomerase [Desulfuromonadales bacterium]